MHSLAIIVVSLLSTLTLAAKLPLLQRAGFPGGGGPGPVQIHTSLCANGDVAGLGAGIVEATNNIAFSLISVSKANHNDQTPLALASSTAPAVKGPGLSNIVTANSPNVDAQNFTITDGGVTAFNSQGAVVAVSDVVNSVNGFLSFTRGITGQNLTPAKSYCVDISLEAVVIPSIPEVDFSLTYTLAVNERADLFSLCKKNVSDVGSFLIFNETSTGAWATCTAVDVFLVIQ